MSETPRRRRRTTPPSTPTYGGALGGRQPLGRSEELLARDEENYRFQHARGSNPMPPKRPTTQKHKKRGRAGWACLFVFCLLVTLAMGVLALPMLTGLAFDGVPSYAFINGSIISMDAERVEAYRQARASMNNGTIYAGVTIDGVDVSGMTKAQAIFAVNAASPAEARDFDVRVTVGDSTWTVDSAAVPMTRNTEAVVDRAYSYGRSNSTSIRGTGTTPFAERLGTVRYLQEHPVSLTTELTYDYSAFRAMAEEAAAAGTVEPVNATVTSFDMNTKTFSFSEDVSGTVLHADTIYDAVMAQLSSGSSHVSLTFEPEEVLADVLRSELLSSFGKVASYTTKTTSNKNRNTNIRLSAEAINGTLVEAGETFSFNTTVGERTAAKGYKPAAAISGGQTNDEIGGGVCQTSSTLFNAAMRADLEIVTRSPHAWPSSYVEKGMDATVNWPGLDFKFRNSSEYPIVIVASYSNQKVTCEIYGKLLADGVTIDLESRVVKTIEPASEPKYVQNTELPAGTQKTTVKARTGYEVVTDRVYYRAGKEISRTELCKSTYKAYQETIEYN